MSVNPVFTPASSVAPPKLPSLNDAPGRADGFSSALSQAVQSLDQLQKQADVGTIQAAAGEQVDLHDVMIAQDRASLGLQVALQVRNKLVEAYQDIMRMQI
ncbi:MAG: flagellar hook-basal body complex protein FliE [Chloroflexi bacterium]|nr:flagellar hook-basal body complex protein FliE [Chloroflexota bacterium]